MIRLIHGYIRLLLSLPIFMMFGALEIGHTSQNWDPPAIDVFPDHNAVAPHGEQLPSMLEAGRKLFVTRFTLADGAGRPGATGDSKPTVRDPRLGNAFTRAAGLDANSCAGCHNQPVTGGSGDFAVNVFVGAQFSDPPTQSISTNVTSERNTIGLFGAGAIEMLAREMTEDLQAQKIAALERARVQNQNVPVSLETKGVHFGTIVAKPNGSYDASRLQGVDADLVIKPFAAKGVVISLREFTINALNHHHGIQALERFGWERTGRRDFDEDGVEVEFTVGQTSALTLFQASLPAPLRALPRDEQQASQLRRGEEAFIQVGCASCHIPALPLRGNTFSEPNPYNRPGNLLPEDVVAPILMPLPLNAANEGGVYKGANGVIYVAAFMDLKRHRICDEHDPFFCNERLRQDFVPTDTFITSKLWDVGSSMPFGHRGDCTTVSEAILHHSAEAKASRDAFLQLDDASKSALIRFLLSLSVPLLDPLHPITSTQSLKIEGREPCLRCRL